MGIAGDSRNGGVHRCGRQRRARRHQHNDHRGDEVEANLLHRVFLPWKVVINCRTAGPSAAVGLAVPVPAVQAVRRFQKLSSTEAVCY
jgi:hypothetical protein